MAASKKINALTLPISDLLQGSKTILDSDKLYLRKDLKNLIRLKRKPIEKPSHNCSSILPGSGHSLIVKIGSDGRYIFHATFDGSKGVLGDSRDFKNKRKLLLLQVEDGDALLRAIRLSQMITKAFASRLEEIEVDSSKSPYVFVPEPYIELLNYIEDLLNGDTHEIENLRKSDDRLFTTYSERIIELCERFKELGIWLSADHNFSGIDDSMLVDSEKRDSMLADSVERAYFSPTWTPLELGDFLGTTKPNEYNQDAVRNVLREALIELFLPSEWISTKRSSSLEKEYPLPTLSGHGITEDYYNDFKSACSPIHDALIDKEKQSDSKKIKEGLKDCKKLLDIANKDISTEQLVRFPREILTKKLDALTVEYELFSSMEAVLKNVLPGLYKHTKEESEPDELQIKLSTAYQKSANIRYDVAECKKIVEKVRNLIRDKSTSKDFENKRQPIEELSREHQKTLQEILNEKVDLAELSTKVEDIKKSMLAWQNETERKLSKVSSDDSVLWIGLGQAGGQILRECILYCLENLNDARCTALLRSLGVDKEKQKTINDQMKKIHSTNRKIALEAEKEIQSIAHNNLHILAINLGEEIDDLVVTGEPGYFIWGKEVEEAKNSRVTRGRMNTLKLKSSGEGAGGRTGLGRAFGFKFYREIEDVIGQVGCKGSRNPKHIVITHSFAGGSGSGMILPVLQQARRRFGSEAIIWVMSVGGGDAETKRASHFNTPFILSDILQAHYDGIHAIMDPIEYTQWSIFKDGLRRHRSSMLNKMKELIQLSGIESADDGVMNKFEELVDVRNTVEFTKKKYSVFTSLESIMKSKTPDGYPINSLSKYSDEDIIWQSISTGDLFEELEEILPSSREQTTIFNNWCEVQERGGKRPALFMWMNWINCMTDPLGYFITGRKKGHQTKADSDSDSDLSEQQFLASLTSDNLEAVLAAVHMNKGLKSKQTREVKTLPEGLRPLEDILERMFTGNSDEDEEIFEKLKSIIASYGDSLDQYNQLCENLTAQVLSMAGASSDARIKSIIVSNSHLELGANATQNLIVSGATYTVYNSVIFDLMLNIIGPRLPTETGIFINTDAEEFDEQDLISITKPPLVVGLLNQRDSISLEESPFVTDKLTINPSSLQEILNSMFSSVEVCEGLANPLKIFSGMAPDEIRQLFLSFFGKRHLYLLQHNPYHGIIKQEESELLNSFVQEFTKKWDGEGVVYGSNSDIRENIVLTDGLTSTHFGNFFRWISLISIDSLSRILSKNIGHFEELKDEFKKCGWDEMTLGYTDMDLGVYAAKPTIGAFSNLEKVRVNEKRLYQVLPKLGIRNVDILRTVSASYLNSYLPTELLFHEDEGEEPIEKISFAGKKDGYNSEQMKQIVRHMLGVIKKQHSLKNDGALDSSADFSYFEQNSGIFEATNQLLNEYDLLLSVNSKTKTYHVNLHPRVSRYLSVVRDVPMQSRDLLLPARNTGASLARYLYYRDPPTKSIASPTFVLGGEIMNIMRYLGLLPDETRLSLVPFLRIILLGACSSSEFKNRLATQASSAGIDLDSISELIDEVFEEHPYNSLEVYNIPELYCEHASVLQNRLRISRTIAEKLSNQFPSRWTANDRLGLQIWLEITNDDNDIVLGIENFGEGGDALSRVRDWLHDLRLLSQKSFEPEVEETPLNNPDSQVNTVSNENSTIISIKQLFFDISSLMNESLGQAEYMHKASKNSRVHFEMTGFSDRLIGKPSGLLALIHDRNPKLALDPVRESVRNGIYSFLGELADPKEYFTAADFGPTSYVTMVFQQAPAACVAEEFSTALTHENVGLGSRDPDQYHDITRLHPYIFLYNMLWLPAKIEEWTQASNSDFIRYFQIPTRVIQHHYQNPKSISMAVNSIETHESYRNGQVQMPKDDVRDMQNAMKKERKHLGVRNIVPLLGIMALRHENAGDLHEEKLWEGEGVLEPEEYKVLVEKLEHKGKIRAEKIYLDPELESKVVQEEASETDLGKLIGTFNLESGESGTTGKESADTLKSRTKEWFKAYADWLHFTEDEAVQ